MLKSKVQIGKVYAVKVSGRVSPVRIDGVGSYTGWNGVNLATGRSIHIKTAAKLRYEMVRRANDQGWERKGVRDLLAKLEPRKASVNVNLSLWLRAKGLDPDTIQITLQEPTEEGHLLHLSNGMVLDGVFYCGGIQYTELFGFVNGECANCHDDKPYEGPVTNCPSCGGHGFMGGPE